MRLERDQIERRDFDRRLRGYDAEQVNAHLHQIAVAVGDFLDRLGDANEELPKPVRQRLQAIVDAKRTEGEIERARAIEESAQEISRLVDETLERFEGEGSVRRFERTLTRTAS